MRHRLSWGRYFLTLYWLFFAALAVYLGQYPGYVLHPELAPYPWEGVLITCIALAIAVAILYAILRPGTFDRSWGRLAIALFYAGLLLLFGAVTFVTDMPGYYYVPAYFAAMTTLILLVRAFVMGATTLWHRARHES